MKIIKSALSVGICTFISRLFGFLRDVIIAFFLGAGPINDAFIVAFRLPNTFRSIFAEGAFMSAFIPIFTKKIKDEGIEKARLFAQNTQSILTITLLIFSAIVMFFMEYIVKFMAPGYSHDVNFLLFIKQLSLIAFPYIIFISLTAFYGAICNTLGSFMPFASAPIILNLVLLVLINFGETKETKAYFLSLGITIAGILEMLWVMYFVIKHLKNLRPIYPKLNDDLRILFRKILPIVFGSGITQVNIFINTIIASFITSGISYIYYADRIYQLPLAVVGTALGSVMLPVLSKAYDVSTMKKFFVLQNQAILFMLFFSIPATLGIILFGYEIIEVLFEYGEFTKEATKNTSDVLRIFALALPAYCFYKIFSAIFFAVGDTKTPVKIAIMSLIINVIIGFMCLPFLKHAAIAVGSVVASYFNISVLYYLLLKGNLHITYSKTIDGALKMLKAGGIMVIIATLVSNFLIVDGKVLRAIILISVSAISYYAACVVFAPHRLRSISRALFKSMVRKKALRVK